MNQGLSAKCPPALWFVPKKLTEHVKDSRKPTNTWKKAVIIFKVMDQRHKQLLLYDEWCKYPNMWIEVNL
jgi:hypothetical protein